MAGVFVIPEETRASRTLSSRRGILSFIALIALSLLSFAPSTVLASLSYGTITSSQSQEFTFLNKFCFDHFAGEPPQPAGAVELVITAADPKLPLNAEGLQFWMFDDEDSSWPQMPRSRMSCVERERYSRGVFPITFAPAQTASAEDGIAVGQMVYRHVFDISQKIRPRTWWFGLVNCHRDFGNIKWKLHSYNLHTRALYKEFGVNERHVSFMYPAFFAAFLLISAVHIYGLWSQSEAFAPVASSGVTVAAVGSSFFRTHQVVQLFTISLLLMTLSLFFKQAHTALYALNGMGIRILDRLADVVDAVSRVQLTMLIMLLGSGWTISAAAATNKRLILCSLGTFGLLYVLLLVIRFLTLDTNYVEVPLVLVVVLNGITVAWVGMAGWFVITVMSSYNKEYKPQKRSMYLRLGFVYTFWLLCEPAVVLLTQLLSPWVRDKIIIGVEGPLSIIAYGWMAFLLWPSRASEYFMLDLPDVHDDFLSNPHHNDFL